MLPSFYERIDKQIHFLSMRFKAGGDAILVIWDYANDLGLTSPLSPQLAQRAAGPD